MILGKVRSLPFRCISLTGLSILADRVQNAAFAAQAFTGLRWLVILEGRRGFSVLFSSGKGINLAFSRRTRLGWVLVRAVCNESVEQRGLILKLSIVANRRVESWKLFSHLDVEINLNLLDSSTTEVLGCFRLVLFLSHRMLKLTLGRKSAFLHY